MNVSRLNKNFTALLIVLVIFQNCDGRKFRSVTGEAEDYLTINRSQNIETRISFNEETSIRTSAGLYNDPEKKIKYRIVTLPKLGTIEFFDEMTGDFSYKTNENANGVDYFEVVAEIENIYTSNPYKVELEIFPVNDLPIAISSNLNTHQGLPIDGVLRGVDVDDEPVTFEIVSQPGKGVLQLLDAKTGAIRYTPTAGLTGSDSFTFKVSDQVGSSSVASVRVNLNNINDAPEAQDIVVSSSEDLAKGIQLRATDADVDQLSYRVTSQPGNGRISVSAGSGVVLYTPGLNFTGSDSFRYVASDGSVDSTEKIVTIEISQ